MSQCCKHDELVGRGLDLLTHNIAMREDVIRHQEHDVTEAQKVLRESRSHLAHLRAALTDAQANEIQRADDRDTNALRAQRLTRPEPTKTDIPETKDDWFDSHVKVINIGF